MVITVILNNIIDIDRPISDVVIMIIMMMMATLLIATLINIV